MIFRKWHVRGRWRQKNQGIGLSLSFPSFSLLSALRSSLEERHQVTEKENFLIA